MLKICKRKWAENKKYLFDEILNYKGDFEYIDLVKLTVNCILNRNEPDYELTWDVDHITVIDDGDYQGTLLFLIPAKTYQPSEYEYLLTFVGYGSCSGCDSLLAVHEYCDEMTVEKANRYLALCRGMITNMIKPYNYGWRCEEEYVLEEMKND